MSPQGMALVFLAVAALSMHVRGIATASQAPAGQGAALAEGLSRLNGATDRAGSSLSGTRGAAMAQWVKMAEEQGEIVRIIQEDMKADLQDPVTKVGA